MFDVFWTSCEGVEDSCTFDNRVDAEYFAQMCHELGDTEIRIEIDETVEGY